MPNHCSSPRCKSNYRGEPYTPVFKLPTAPQELRTQWLNGDNIADLSNIYVCMHHVHPKDIVITVDRILQADGNLLKEYEPDQNSVKMLYHRSYPAALHIFRRSHYQDQLDLSANQKTKNCSHRLSN